MFRALETRIYRWLRDRRDRRVMRGQSSLVKADPQSTPAATAWANMIQASIKARKDVCKICLHPFDFWEPTPGQKFQLRCIMGLSERDLDPKLCKSCHDTAINTFNPRYTMPGTNNAGPANLLLIDKYTNGSKNHG